jgi:hypothetical protein
VAEASRTRLIDALHRDKPSIHSSQRAKLHLFGPLPDALHCRSRELSLFFRDGRTGHDVGHGAAMASYLNLLAGFDAIKQRAEGILCLEGSDLFHDFSSGILPA